MIAIALSYYNIFIVGYLNQVLADRFLPPFPDVQVAYSAILSYVAGLSGALICGFIGDTFGRRRILAATIAVVAAASLIVSVLPTYSTIGVSVSFVFMIVRAVQMFAFGGDMVGLITFLLEDTPSTRRGSAGGWMSCGAGVGVMLASFVVWAIGIDIDGGAMWDWRIALWLGGSGIAVAMYFLHTFDESSTFSHFTKRHHLKAWPPSSWPLWDLIENYKLQFLSVIGLTVLAPIITIVIFGYIPYVDIGHLHLSRGEGVFSNTIALGCFVVGAPIFGVLSDRVGRKPILCAVAASLFILGYPLFALLDYVGLLGFILVQATFGFITSGYYGVTMAATVEHLPTHVRYTGVALGYYTSYAVLGGLDGNAIVTYLANTFGLDLGPALFLAAGALVVFIAALLMKEEANHRLADD